MRPQYHFRPVDGHMHIWDVRRLLRDNPDAPGITLQIAEIAEVDEAYWFDRAPTCREVLTHADLIAAADLSYPILICQNRRIIDGMHRVLRAISTGLTTIDARQITLSAPHFIDVEPDALNYDP